MEFLILPEDKKGLVCETLAQSLNLIKRLQTDNDKLQNTLDDVLDRQPILVARAEKYAVEEFAEMITNRASAVQVGNISWVWQISQDDMDDLVKEKVGESDD